MVSETISPDEIRCVAEKRIFWGHQSVGGNILDGIREVVGEVSDSGLEIRNTSLASELNSPVFAHRRVGTNMEPLSKIKEFESILNNGVGEKCNIAALKFCYIDVQVQTDIETLFRHYLEFSDRVRQTYPNLKLIHFTIPLTSRQRGIKAWIKRFTGRPLRGFENNIRRISFQ